MRRFLLSSFCSASSPSSALSFGAEVPIPSAPTVDARSYIVVDYRTGKTLAALEPTARMEPASLTKLMTSYIVFQKLAAGELKLTDQVVVSEHAWRSEGSRTFIELGKPVSVEFLILGMIVQSGNDATIALAERIAGTEETFAQLMNSTAQRLGMVGTHFENSSGLPSPSHYTTAHDMALLATAIIHDYPQFYKYLLGARVRVQRHQAAKSQRTAREDPTVDGLKTGHTDSAGYCLVTSSLRDGMRLISVVLGSTSMKARENASAALLNYGFSFYDTKLVVKGGTKLASTPVWKAASAGRRRHQGRSVHHPAAQPVGRHQDGGRSEAAPDRAARTRRRCRTTARVHRRRAADDRARSSPCARRGGRLVAPDDRHHQTLVRVRMPLPLCYLNGEYLPLRTRRCRRSTGVFCSPTPSTRSCPSTAGGRSGCASTWIA